MISSDAPISDPKDDWLGVDPFARAVARGVENLKSPEGTVLAMTGVWGSGKSSVTNLVLHHLKLAVDEGRLDIIQFNPWWYSNEELLTRAFFQHLYSGLGLAISERARSVILALSKRLLSSSSLVSGAVGLLTLGLGGKAIEQAASFASDLIKVERTAEDEYRALSEELEGQSKRFLVVIDDIDRLTPDQTLSVFRLVKSVGRLPNVIYMLVFDRELAERILLQRYPAERHFLEKIVQATFEVPPPDPTMLQDALLNVLVELGGHPNDQDGVRFRNVLTDVVYPSLQLPRDLGRLINNINVSWAAIGAEVNYADLVAIESLKLFRLPVYQAIRKHKDMLCGSPSQSMDRRNLAQLYDSVFIPPGMDEKEKDVIRTGLRRLFPRLDSVWSNVFHSSSGPTWRANRQICSPSVFSTYFSMAPGPDVLPKRALERFLASVGAPDMIKSLLREHAKAVRKDGKSEVPILLDDLMGLQQKIPPVQIETLLGAMLELADELDIDRDQERGAFGNSNQLRMLWLFNSLVDDRLPQSERSPIYRRLIPTASLEWALYMTRRIYSEHHPSSQDRQVHPSMRHVDGGVADELAEIGRIRLSKAASDGTLLRALHFLPALYSWLDLNNGDATQVLGWTNSQLADDNFILRMTEAMTSTIWRTSLGWDGMGDRVSQGIPMAQPSTHAHILDVPRFWDRLDEVEKTELNDAQRQIVARFREGVRNQENDRRGPFAHSQDEIADLDGVDELNEETEPETPQD